MEGYIIAICVVVISMLFISILLVITRYKKCPSDKIMVIYGKIGNDKDGSPRTCKCIHGGAALILPLVQNYAFLDLTPITLDLENVSVYTSDDIEYAVTARISVGITTEEAFMIHAAERLLGLSQSQIKVLATDIAMGQLRLLASETDAETMRRQRFINDFAEVLQSQLNLLGIRIININISKIKPV